MPAIALTSIRVFTWPPGQGVINLASPPESPCLSIGRRDRTGVTVLEGIEGRVESRRPRKPCRCYRVNRPNKSLQPFELVIHDCLLAARRRASVRPIVRRALGLESESGSLIFASVCSFLSAAAAASAPAFGPNSLSLRFFFITLSGGSRAGGGERSRASSLDEPPRNVSTLCSNSD